MTEIENKIMTKKRFSEAVEKEVRSKNMPFMDAVLTVCELNEIDPIEVNRLLSDSIKLKIEAEAMNLNLIPKANELPFE